MLVENIEAQVVSQDNVVVLRNIYLQQMLVITCESGYIDILFHNPEYSQHPQVARLNEKAAEELITILQRAKQDLIEKKAEKKAYHDDQLHAAHIALGMATNEGKQK